MTPDEIRARVHNLRVWSRGDQRAPHKPLLLLLALARFAGGQERLPYSEIEGPLRRLLNGFGPPRGQHQPAYPFWRLQSDGLWALDGTDGLVQRQSNSDPTVTSLRAVDPVGHFPEALAATLRARPDLIGDLALDLLTAAFPASVHDDLLSAVGLDPEAEAPRRPRRRRDPAFREAVLRAYGYRCAVCGFETRVGGVLVGLDAAHVRWHQYHGPDEVSNGLALCTLHHRLLDRGAFTVAAAAASERVVEVAEDAHGGAGFERWLLAFHGRPLADPVRPADRIAEPSAEWHRREVFRGPGRPRTSV